MRKLLYKRHKLIGNKGFSLVELIIVIAIMAVLMAVLAPQLIRYVEKSRVAADDTAAGEILNAVKVAINDATIYDSLANGDQVIWYAGASPTITDTNSAVDIAGEVTSVISPIPSAKSNQHKAGTSDTYTVTINIVNNVASVSGAWGAGT